VPALAYSASASGATSVQSHSCQTFTRMLCVRNFQKITKKILIFLAIFFTTILRIQTLPFKFCAFKFSAKGGGICFSALQPEWNHFSFLSFTLTSPI